MRLVVSLALVTSLMGSALPVAARQHTPMTGLIARSITQAAARFATVQQSTPVDSEWSRVRRLAPGTELVVIVTGSRPANRYFVAGDASDLTVLNVGDPALPAAARDVLRNLASTHPEYSSPRKTVDGLRSRKTCAWDQTACSWPIGRSRTLRRSSSGERHEITEIATAKTASNPVGCALAGYYGGGILGGIPGAVIGGAVGRDTGPALLGMMVGSSIGAVDVYRKCRDKPERIIYSAP